MALLEEQNREDDIAALLTSTARQPPNFDLLARVEQVAERNGLPTIREQAITRQATLTADPVERTRLRLMLARLAEERKDRGPRSRRSRPLTKRIRILLAWCGRRWTTTGAPAIASAPSIPWRRRRHDRMRTFKRQFALEAARKATELGDYARARKLLDPLLAAEPLASDVVAAAADTYGRAGDDCGFRAFYTDRLKLARTPATEGRFTARVDPGTDTNEGLSGGCERVRCDLQSFPEDEALAGEAARYARKYNVADRLTAFYTKAASRFAAGIRAGRWCWREYKRR